MKLIIGGAYQGKLDYALETYGLTEKDVFTCDEESTAIGFEEKIIDHFERYVLALEKLGQNPERTIKTMIPAGRFEDRIVIADDISQGVVPTDQITRAWREDTGRCLVMLAKEADEVVRVFCGIPQIVKSPDDPKEEKPKAAGAGAAAALAGLAGIGGPGRCAGPRNALQGGAGNEQAPANAAGPHGVSRDDDRRQSLLNEILGSGLSQDGANSATEGASKKPGVQYGRQPNKDGGKWGRG